MRLVNYINEDEEAREYLIDWIRRDCGPFLRTIKPIMGSGKCFVRRIHGYMPFVVKKTSRTDRRPSDTDIEFHKAFDAVFKEKFGWGARSEGVFTYPAKDWKLIHQGQHIFYPVGEFKFVYSPVISDLFVELNEFDRVENEVNRLLPSYVNKNLLGVFRGKFDGRNFYPEVMFKCKQYYLVNREYADLLTQNEVL